MTPEEIEQHELRMQELDKQGIAALFEAAKDYHKKHSGPVGVSRTCICGEGHGGSDACRGLQAILSFFRCRSWNYHGREEDYARLRSYLMHKGR